MEKYAAVLKMKVLVKRSKEILVKHLKPNAVAIKGEMKLESRLHNAEHRVSEV
jgi:hypothetical protein